MAGVLTAKESINKSENRTPTSTAAWSKDGKTLTIQTNTVFNREGERSMKLVYDKK